MNLTQGIINSQFLITNRYMTNDVLKLQRLSKEQPWTPVRPATTRSASMCGNLPRADEKLV